MKLFKTLVTVPLACLLAMPVYAHHPDEGYARYDKRVERQQSRIRQGIKSGELTRQEAKQLRQQQRKIAKLARKFNRDGYLSRHEKRKLEKKQDKASKRIYRLKHNDQYKRHRVKHKPRYVYRDHSYRHLNGDGWSLVLRLSDYF